MSPRQRQLGILPIVLAALVSGLFLPPSRAQVGPKSSVWESAIGAFERQDKEKPPPQNAILFVGSSSIRLWDLPKSFPSLETINRGFGGSQLADSAYFARRIVTKYRPRIVVLYAGDNDIAFGKSPEQVAADFQAFAKAIHHELPKTNIVYLSIKPSIQRWKLWSKGQKANALIGAFCKKDPRLVYVDVGKPMLGDDGKPRPELFSKDGLHMNARGYEVWASLLEPLLR